MLRLVIYGTVLSLSVAAFSDEALTVAYLSFILPGMVLAIAPTVLLYLPFADLTFTGLRRRKPVLAVAGLASLLLLAFGLPLAGQLALHAAIGPAAPGEEQALGNGPPQRLLIHTIHRIGRARLLPERRDFIGAGSDCDDLCARLLLDGRVQEVVRPYKPETANISLAQRYRGRALVYSLIASSSCPDVEPGSVRARLETLTALGAGRRCIAVREVDEAKFDAALTVESADLTAAPFLPVPFVAERLTRFAAWACTESGCREVASAAAGTAMPLADPLHVFIPPFLSTLPREWARRQVVLNTVATFPWASLGLVSGAPHQDASGIASADHAPQSREAVRAAALRVLTDNATDVRWLRETDGALIEPALEAIAQRSGPLEPEDLELMRAFIRNPRANAPWRLDYAFRKHPEAAELLKDDLIPAYLRLAQAEAERQEPLKDSWQRSTAGEGQSRFRRTLADAIAQLSERELEPHHRALLEVMSKPGMEKDAPGLRTRLQAGRAIAP